MPTTADFESSYQKLNSAQRHAVDTLEGPVLVLAGPGTGKTQVLTVRIANILKNSDVGPESILALTFTEAAAKEMKERLVRLIGKDAYYVKITTFHSFCSEVINENPERFTRSKNLQVANDLEKIQVISEILENNSFTLLKPLGDPLFYLRYILSSIGTLKREGVTLPKYLALVTLLKEEFETEKDSLGKTAFIEKEKLLNKNLDLLEIYQKYEEKLASIGRYDYDDMINWVVDAFETDTDFALVYQEKYQYILADEYQDTNSSQNRLLFALTQYWGDGANIFAVGDPNQSIFRFQGASKENVIQFKNRFTTLAEVNLTENYRSTPIILHSSAKLLNENLLNPNVSYKHKKIKVAKFTSPILEDEFLTDSIKKKIKKGVKPKNIAVIVKENKDVENLVDIFKKKGIPYRLQGGSDILKTPLVSQFLKILKVVVGLKGGGDDLELFTILNFPFLGLDPFTVLKISREAHDNKKSLVETLLNAKDIDTSLKATIEKFVQWNHLSASHSLPDIFQIILQESGLLDHLLSLPQPIIELNRFGTLFENVKSQAEAFPGLTLTDYVRNLSIMEDQGIRLDEQVLLGNEDAVTLTTAHKSKGLEWRIVYVYKFAESYWSNKGERQMIKLPPGIISAVEQGDKLAEERRLLYVALTRAKQQIYLLGSQSYPGSTKMVFPSMFLHDLPKENLKFIKTTGYEKRAKTIVSQNLTPAKETSIEKGEEQYLTRLVNNFMLSPTALNTYLQCGYKFKLDNLYKIPRAKASAMCFGTAVHFALENLYLNLKSNKLISKEEFVGYFENALKKEILSDSEYKERLKHGKDILSGYYDFYKNSFSPALFTEKKFGSSHSSQIFLDDIPLTGKVDRIDIISESNKTVRFTDYKTGKVRTRGEIEGTTKNSDGSYKRQLIFYKLLSDLDKSFPYEVAETELDFIEPKSGVYKKEKFTITDDDIANLKDLITTSIQSIRELRFQRTQDFNNCLQCDFRSHCWPDGLPKALSLETDD